MSEAQLRQERQHSGIVVVAVAKSAKRAWSRPEIRQKCSGTEVGTALLDTVRGKLIALLTSEDLVVERTEKIRSHLSCKSSVVDLRSALIERTNKSLEELCCKKSYKGDAVTS